ncbi:MAG: UDP-N-acetylmuramoyl-L-alanyl-D-glutamate--2,6-diaminopimelate ligase [Flammeovirgaceae bacterium]|nr:UDP-N-acetylmuramoyl-L-alanyl-D-glutamate--2,6-diaminopimelate ligase [Flammeovirgaceae bacterium]|tara:strand:+ start:2201 stop:3640 length:1440 start_codon:yes stop_codon:yes gene_type:complete
MKKLRNLLEGIEIISSKGDLDVDILGVSTNSKLTEEGYIFFAVKGNNLDGHEFIDGAIRNGSNCIICSVLPKKINIKLCYVQVKNIRFAINKISSKFYNNPANKLKVIAVTGTNGKTSIVYFLYQFLLLLDKKVGMLSTIENKIKDKSISSSLTTPDPIEINKLMSEMIKMGIEYCVMEASSHAIDQIRISGSDMYVAIFSNISHDHLDYHKTFLNYINTKKKLFDQLSENSFSVINTDDKRADYIVQNSKSKVINYSVKSISENKARIIEKSVEGMLVEIDNQKVSLGVLGEFNLYNILSVYVFSKILKIDKIKSLKILSKLKPPKGRLEFIKSSNGSIGIVDYAHTPDALRNVLITLDDIKGDNKLISIIGAGGDRDKKKRPEMGRVAEEYSDYVIVTSDNPRNENQNDIIDDITKGFKYDNYKIEIDRKRAITNACNNLDNKSILLVAGKGHEDYQIIGENYIPHNDMEILKNELK